MNAAVFNRTWRDLSAWRTYILIIAMAGLAIAFTLLPHAFAGQEEQDAQTFASGWALWMGGPIVNGHFFLILLAVLSGVAATASEWRNGTTILLFAKPLSRTSIVLGKLGGIWAWSWTAILLSALAAVIAGVIQGVGGLGDPAFYIMILFAGLVAMVYGTMAALAGFWLRRSVPAMFAAVAILLALMPLAAASGFGAHMASEDFREQGVFPSWSDQYEACPSDDFYDAQYDYQRDNRPHDWRDPTNRTAEEEAALEASRQRVLAELDALDECLEPLVADAQAFYENEGIEPPVSMADEQRCYFLLSDQFYESDEPQTPFNEPDCGHSDMCSHMIPMFVRRDVSLDDWPAIKADVDITCDDVPAQRAMLFSEKLSKPTITIPRYLSASGLWGGWDMVSQWNGTGSIAAHAIDGVPDTRTLVFGLNAAGADPNPTSGGLTVVAAFGHLLLWTVAAIASVRYRDLQ